MEHEGRQDINESLPSTISCHQDIEKLHEESSCECSNETASHVILKVMDEETKKADSVVVLQVKDDHTTKHEVYGDQKICRICHLGNLESSSTELIQLGCGCKGELGVSHLACARTWFIQKGDRVCEICGKIASNVSGLEDVMNNVMTIDLMVEWGDTRLLREAAAARASSAAVSDKCKRTFRNIVMACLVLAFVVPWFVRADF